MATYTYSQQVANQQAALNAANKNTSGYVPLVVDGFLGPKTQAAINQYGSGTGSTSSTSNTTSGTSSTSNRTSSNTSGSSNYGSNTTYSNTGTGKNITSTSTKDIQSFLGVATDGIYGPKTTAAVKAFQAANGLAVDGIWGPKTQAAYLASIGGGTSPTPTTQSSAAARQAAIDAQNKLLNEQNATNPAKATVDPKKNPNSYLDDEDYSDIEARLKAITDSANSEVKSITNIFDNVLSKLDSNSKNVISSIQNTFARRVVDMENSNRQLQAGVTTAGLVSGRARYAPEIQTSILSAAEKAGINRITDLNVQEQQLVAEAQSASDNKRMDILFKKMDLLAGVKKSKLEAIASLNKEVMEQEKLNIQIAQERRQQLKDDLANQQTLAENLSASLVNAFGNDPAANQRMIEEAAAAYGIDTNFLTQAVNKYQNDQSKTLPSDIREYDEMVARGQYSGTFLQWQKAKAAASKISSGGAGTKGLTRADTDRYDLPVELVGRTPTQIIQDLSVSRIPDWFKKSQARAGHPADQANWDMFRGSPDMMIFRNTVDISKGGLDTDEDF